MKHKKSRKHIKKHVKHRTRHRRHHKRTTVKEMAKPEILIKISEVLPPSDVKLSESDTVQDAIKLFSRYQLSGAPVFHGKKLVGIVTTTDITNFIDKKGVTDVIEGVHKVPVSKLMTKNPVTIKSDKTVTEAINRMIDNKVSKLIVLDRNNKFLNVISRQDILKKIAFILSKPELTPSSEIETDIDDLYLKIVEKVSAPAKYFAKELKVSTETIERWARALQEHGLIDIEYTPFGGMNLKIKKRSRK